MNIDLKPYQELAVEKLVAAGKQLLEKEGRGGICVFQAPTGSGKTVMAAKFIENTIRELPDDDFCFIWMTIGKGDLQLQTKHGLDLIFGGAPRVSLVEEEFGGAVSELFVMRLWWQIGRNYAVKIVRLEIGRIFL